MKKQHIILAVLIFITAAAFAPANQLLQKPDSVVTVGNLTETEVSADLFKQQPGLRVNAPEGSPYSGSSVLSFTYTRASLKTNLVEFHVKGADFSSDALEDIAKLKAGDLVYIDNIRLLSPDGKKVELPSMVYKLI